MISVELLSGDMSAGADGTVTMIDGDRVYAFGHRFLAGGPTRDAFRARGSAGAVAEFAGVVQDFGGSRMDGRDHGRSQRRDFGTRGAARVDDSDGDQASARIRIACR